MRPLTALGDEQLAELIARGDDRAFAVAYERHLPGLVRYCRGIVLIEQDAEDAAQSAMVAALRALPQRPPRLQLRAWLYRVAHNEAVSLLRRRRPHASLDDAITLSTPDVADTAETRARLQELVGDLRSLPERQRGALLMRELCGLDYHEIADAIGCSEAAAMQTVYEARSALVQSSEGRSLSCAGVQRLISDGDRRSMRARRVRAHLRSCQGCTAFQQSLSGRQHDLRLLLPLAGKGMFVGLLAALRVAGSKRLADLAARLPSMPVGVRGAALGATLLASGGVLGVVHHHTTSVRHHPHKLAALTRKQPRGAPGHHTPTRPLSMIVTTRPHKPTRAAHSSTPHRTTRVRVIASGLSDRGSQPAPPAQTPAAPPPMTPAPTPKPAAVVAAPPPPASVKLRVGSTEPGSAHVSATVTAGTTTVSGSANVNLAGDQPVVAVTGNLTSALAHVSVKLCVLRCS